MTKCVFLASVSARQTLVYSGGLKKYHIFFGGKAVIWISRQSIFLPICCRRRQANF
ncbi:MAG: hypothetical protein V7K66_25465 [Nostoc sp.]